MYILCKKYPLVKEIIQNFETTDLCKCFHNMFRSARQLRNMLKYQIAFAVCVSLGLILLAIAFGLANLRKRADLLEFQECGSSWSEWKFYESWEKRYHAVSFL